MMSIELVIPSEGRASRHAKSCDSRRNLHLPRRNSAGLRFERKNLGLLRLERQPMQHVSKSLRMHEPMLDCDPEDLVMRGVVQASIHGLAHVVVVLQYLSYRRPVARFVVRKVSGSGINTKRKQSIEFFLTRIHAECTGTYQIPVKRLQMPEVEDDAVALRNRTIVESLRLNQLKQIVCNGSGIP